MEKKRQIEELSKIIEKIINNNTMIIVEGKKDAAALSKFGIINIMQLSKKPLFEIVESIAVSEKEIIILTDLDKKGKELYGKLSRDFQKYGIKINNELRDFIFTTQIRQIEGLANLLNT